MSRLRRCGWCRVSRILFLYIIAVFPVATLSVQSASLKTHFSFSAFPAADDFITFGDARHSPDTLSFTVNPIFNGFSSTRLSCVKLFYKDKVRMKSRESSAVASFSTSFTFSITQRDQSTNRSGWQGHSYGFMFIFGSEYIFPVVKSDDVKYFGVEFDTYKDVIYEDPSDNHIGIDINNMKSAYTHNLCKGHRTSCSFPWTGRTYTAWIDYNSSTRSLEVWFANGSLREGVMKPAGPGLIKVPDLDLMDVFEDYMYTGFSSEVRPFLQDTHELLSWNFASSYSEAMPARIPAPTPMSPAMPAPTLMRSWLFSKKILIICAACSTTILAVICLLEYGRIRQPHIDKSEPGLGLDLLMGLQRFSFNELKKATKTINDSALLGKGGSGSVYKGTLTPSASWLL